MRRFISALILLQLTVLGFGQVVISGHVATSGSSDFGQAGSAAPVIPASYFGLHFKGTTPWPKIPFGSLRLWDSGTRWQLVEPTEGNFSFTNLDLLLSNAKTNGLSEILLTLSATPRWASSDPDNPNCDYSSTEPGSCGPPLLLNSDGTGTNQHWRNYVFAVVSHVVGLNSSNFARVKNYEMWNEFSRSTSSWVGTNEQLVRMAQDANCIITGRGSITATGEACTAANMHVAAVGVDPAARLATPDSTLTDATALGAYYSTPGATTGPSAAADILTAHTYVQNGTCCAVAETLVLRANKMNSIVPSAASVLPHWSTEGGWGPSDPNLPDPDSEAAFIARYYLLGWTNGFSRLYWYAYDNLTWGTLWNANGVNGCNDGGSKLGCLTAPGNAYGRVFTWMVGNSMTPCSGPQPPATGVWTCPLTSPSGAASLAVWDSSQSCSAGICTTSSFSFPTTFHSFLTLDDSLVHPLSGKTVAIGAKPVLLVTQ